MRGISSLGEPKPLWYSRAGGSDLKPALQRSAVAAFLLVATAFAQAAKLDSQDAALLAARDAFEAGNRARLAAVAPQLQGHVLSPYVEYWQLFLRLPAARAEEVR